MLEPIVVDQYTALSHKALIDAREAAGVAPRWVPAEDRRRLAAYLVRAAYMANGARQLLPDSVSKAARDVHREYGDASLLVDRVVAGVLGDWSLTVDGAGDDLSEGPRIGDPPPDTDSDDPIVARIARIRREAWVRRADDATDAWEAALAAQPEAQGVQAALRDWADRVGLAATINDIETKADGLGDGVVIAWPRTGDWPLLQSLDPGFFFADLPEDGDVTQFPTRIDFGWEFDRTYRDGSTERMVRLITFRLVPISFTRVGVNDDGSPTWLDAEGNPTDGLTPGDGERVDVDGTIWRGVPWSDELTDTTCTVSDAVYPIDATTEGLRYFDDGAAEWTARNVDLRCDFIPVVHFPGTAAGDEFYGASVIDHGAQVLDDVATNDTDAMSASRFLAEPTIAMSGASAPKGGVVAPGRMYGLGENGRMDVLDLAVGLEKLMAHGDRLQDRYWQTSRVPAEMIGRAEATGAVPGVTLALRFAPFAQIVGQIRAVRSHKHELMLRIVQRLAQLEGVLKPGPTLRARITYGNFLPTNRAEVVEMVARAVVARTMSTQTAVTMMVAAGVPVDDARAEVERIRDENPETYSAAKDLADATGSEQAAANFLGLNIGPAPVAME